MEEEFTVEFECVFRTKVRCKREDLDDTVSDINIPEGENVEYVSDTFEVVSVSDKDGKDVDFPAEE